MTATFFNYVLIMVMVFAPLRPSFADMSDVGQMNGHCSEKHHSSRVMADMEHDGHMHQAMTHVHQAVAGEARQLLTAPLHKHQDQHQAAKHSCCCDGGVCNNVTCNNHCGMHINQTVLSQTQQYTPLLIQTDAISDLVYTLIHRNLTPPERPPLFPA